MQPSNEQVRAACQRAGILASCASDGPYKGLSIRGPWSCRVDPNNDSSPGSALFIVAVLGALQCPHAFRGNGGRWVVTNLNSLKVDDFDTLTAACMAAIVAAYPPVDDLKGDAELFQKEFGGIEP